MKRTGRVIAVSLGFVVLGVAPAFGQACNWTTTQTITLPPSGVIPCTTLTIPVGVTITFTRNATNTPVTINSTGDVSISGTINVSGTNGGNGQSGTLLGSNAGLGGNGGFDGGAGANGIVQPLGGAGLGPGGGASAGTIGSRGGGGGGFGVQGMAGVGNPGGAGGPAYGTPTLLPLIGGSGGGGGNITGFGNTGGGGGGSGGALLINSSTSISFGSGQLKATGGKGGDPLGIFGCPAGGGGGGSGGAIRLGAPTITGTVTIDVTGGQGGNYCGGNGGDGGAGRVRIEGNTASLTGTFPGNVAPSIVTTPGPVTPPSSPTLQIVSVAGVAAPPSPVGSYTNPDIVLPSNTTSPVSILLQASNIPLGTTFTVTAVALNGAVNSATSTGLAGNPPQATVPGGLAIRTDEPSVISATGTFLLASLGGGPVFVEGEPVERVRVTATFGGPTLVTYLTRSGREIPVSTAQ